VLGRNESYPYTLLLQNRTIREEIYNGETPEFDFVMTTYKADTVLTFDELDKMIEEKIRKGMPVYTDFEDSDLKDKILNIVKNLKAPETIISDIAPVIYEMRVHKDSIEILRIQKAIDITGEAFLNACRICRPGMNEFEIEAMTEYIFRKNGSSMPAFESIVGSGPNSVTLHYSANNRKMEDGDLLLMDIGAEYGYNCADITRTIPVNGKFTREQKDIYDLVLKAQKAAIAEMIPGKYLVESQNESSETIIGGLIKLGLITDPGSIWQKKFYLIHGISHYLGMNVHDVGDYGAPDSVFRQNIAADTIYGRLLEEGMILTVEPGLYFRSNGLSQLYEMYGNEATHEEIRNFINAVSPVYEKYKNIGVRIEEDVLITANGCIVLSRNIPKETEEIERIMSKRNY
jgi:Xaa-Pro aminopeptidase